jgi:endonuclease/exonuclease/phosphatase family metal-dependent hydrolase
MKTLRVASYNIRHAADAGFDMSVLAGVIRSVGAEIVGLQEVDMNAARSGSHDQVKELMEALGFEYGEFVRSIDIRGGQYGTAVVSKYSITDKTVYPLYLGPKSEQRMLGVFSVDVAGTELTLANTHLDYLSAETIRTQMREVNAVLKDKDYILTGDFNTTDMTQFYELEGASFTMCDEHRLVTFPSSGITIDNVVYKGPYKLTDFGTVENSYSDHRMLWAEFEIE